VELKIGFFINDRPEYINDRSEVGHWERRFKLFQKDMAVAYLFIHQRKEKLDFI
jgi:IS30 family transposase